MGDKEDRDLTRLLLSLPRYAGVRKVTSSPQAAASALSLKLLKELKWAVLPTDKDCGCTLILKDQLTSVDETTLTANHYLQTTLI